MNEIPVIIANRLKRVPLIWGTLTLFSMLMPLMTRMASQATVSPEQSKVILPLFIAMAVMMAGASVFIRFVLLSEDKIREFAVSKLRSLDKERAYERLFRHWLFLNIIAWALNDSVANLGAVAGQIAGSANTSAAFAAAALGLNLVMYPRFKKAAESASL